MSFSYIHINVKVVQNWIPYRNVLWKKFFFDKNTSKKQRNKNLEHSFILHLPGESNCFGYCLVSSFQKWLHISFILVVLKWHKNVFRLRLNNAEHFIELPLWSIVPCSFKIEITEPYDLSLLFTILRTFSLRSVNTISWVVEKLTDGWLMTGVMLLINKLLTPSRIPRRTPRKDVKSLMEIFSVFCYSIVILSLIKLRC